MTDPSLAPPAPSATPTAATTKNDDKEGDSSSSRYRTLVIDSGPIIKLTGVSSLRQRADVFYTVPAVIAEIRDAKARQHLDQLPFEIKTREPSPASIHAVTEFARLTGDYQSLSSVDLQVLGLLYELEKEGCGGSMEHIRTTPKRTVGVGKIEVLGKKQKDTKDDPASSSTKEESNEGDEESDIEYDEVHEDSDSDGEPLAKEPQKSFFEQPVNNMNSSDTIPAESVAAPPANNKPKSWAMLVNPARAGTARPEMNVQSQEEESKIADEAVHVNFGKMDLGGKNDVGRFSDAEEEEEAKGEDDGEDDKEENLLVKELRSDFPSLEASRLVPYEGEDGHVEKMNLAEGNSVPITDEERKQQALRPITKSGKLYNSFRGYGKLFKPTKKAVNKDEPVEDAKGDQMDALPEEKKDDNDEGRSRIMGGMSMAGQEVEVEDDGEGWITCTKDIRSLQSAGTLAPPKTHDESNTKPGPPINQRTACATTDFAMQNVILQMGLELLSVDGVKIRRLKNWVTRCGACFKVYTKNDDAGPHGMKRLFCERCGSDMLQRIAASVDGKTGRLRLHMSKRHKKSTRGTKFSLPKPGTGDRFQGDILLREDQLLMGAWNQKVKIRSGGKAKAAAQSMFGQDIATNVGCRADAMKVDDINVGFGRRNPNSAKGRERRGKKKKSNQKACGLRRYN